MKTRTLTDKLPQYLLLLATLLLFAAGAAMAQVPVDDEGNPIGTAEPYDDDGAAEADLPRLSMQELDELVGRIALYPDDLLAIVLPASTYPLEIVQAARFLDEYDADSSLKPDDSWDESVTALLNYPEVLRMMNDDIDWTWQLGEAVVAQQNDVIAAVETFRDRAYAAGNLKSDEHQTVSRNDDVIEIEPVDDDVIYVPYYEPQEVVVYQPRPVYYYYPRAYPVYYYPYPAGHHFLSDYFWGVTTAFQIGWTSNYLHVYHHSFHGHPFFGHDYYGNYWRRPSIQVFNNYYGNHGYRHRADRYRYGSYWRPRHHGGARPGHYQARSRYYSNGRRSHSDSGYADRRGDGDRRDQRRDGDGRHDARRDRGQPGLRVDRQRGERRGDDTPVRFRAREQRNDADRNRNRGNNDGAAARRGNTQRFAANGDDRRRGADSNASRSRIAGSRNNNRGSSNARRADPIANSRQRAEPIANGRQRAAPMARGAERRATPPAGNRSQQPTLRRAPPRPAASPPPQRRASPSPRRAAPAASTNRGESRRESRGPAKSSSSRRSSSRSNSNSGRRRNHR